VTTTSPGRLGAPRVGDLRWSEATWRRGVWQRWSGTRWATATYAAFPERMHERRLLSSYDELPAAKRQRLLQIAVDLEVLDGADVVHQGPDGVVLSRRRKVSHVLHGVLTLMSGGVWGFVWVAMCVARKEDRVRLQVDPWGAIWPTEMR
jgi:hypothetical protein